MQAFGVGAFEENDDDIYSKEDMSQYDFALETPEERKRRKMREDSEKRKKKNKENCIDGFKISSEATLRRKIYPPPNLPQNFQPFHASKKSRFETAKPEISDKKDALSKGLARHSLTIPERQVLIEDDVNKMPVVLKTSEVEVEHSGSKDSQSTPNVPAETDDDIQRRVDRLKKFTQVLQAYSTKTPEETQKAAFKPFMKNPEKQERYEKYLTLRDAGFSGKLF